MAATAAAAARRSVLQLKRLTLVYCEKAGSSRNLRCVDADGGPPEPQRWKGVPAHHAVMPAGANIHSPLLRRPRACMCAQAIRRGKVQRVCGAARDNRVHGRDCARQAPAADWRVCQRGKALDWREESRRSRYCASRRAAAQSSWVQGANARCIQPSNSHDGLWLCARSLGRSRACARRC